MHPPATTPPPTAFRNEPLTDFALDVNRESMQQAIDRARARFDAGPRIVVPVVIDGAARETTSRMERCDPSAHGRVVAEVCLATAADASRAVDVAAAALPSWRGMGFRRRAEILRRAAAIIRERRFDLAATQVFEVGKPLARAIRHSGRSRSSTRLVLPRGSMASNWLSSAESLSERLTRGSRPSGPSSTSGSARQPRAVTGNSSRSRM